MRGVVVDDGMHVDVGRRVGVEHVEKVPTLLLSLAGVAGADRPCRRGHAAPRTGWSCHVVGRRGASSRLGPASAAAPAAIVAGRESGSSHQHKPRGPCPADSRTAPRHRSAARRTRDRSTACRCGHDAAAGHARPRSDGSTRDAGPGWRPSTANSTASRVAAPGAAVPRRPVVRERRYSAVSDLVPAHRAATRRDHPPRIAAATSGRYPGSYRAAARRAYLASHARPTRRCDCERPTAAGWCRRAPSAPMWHAARRSAAMRQLDSWAARYQTVRLRTSSFAITALGCSSVVASKEVPI